MIRLYPRTPDPARLERLVCVPPGTMAALRAIEAAHPLRDRPGHPDEDAFYRALYASPKSTRHSVDDISDAELLRSFLTYGWGRAASGALVAMATGDALTGACADPDQCFRALWAQVQRSKLLAWSFSSAAGPLQFRSVEEVVELAEGLRWG